jgi:hypothetical protein
MTAVVMGIFWGGYAISSWGWCLLKGWDIPFREWVSPINPYTWPSDGSDPPTIPSMQVWPSKAPAAS